jgi:hypothetical protein
VGRARRWLSGWAIAGFGRRIFATRGARWAVAEGDRLAGFGEWSARWSRGLGRQHGHRQAAPRQARGPRPAARTLAGGRALACGTGLGRPQPHPISPRAMYVGLDDRLARRLDVTSPTPGRGCARPELRRTRNAASTHRHDANAGPCGCPNPRSIAISYARPNTGPRRPGSAGPERLGARGLALCHGRVARSWPRRILATVAWHARGRRPP